MAKRPVPKHIKKRAPGRPRKLLHPRAGRKAHLVTNETVTLVAIGRAIGETQEEIAKRLRISLTTLKAYYAEELKGAADELMIRRLKKSGYLQAIGGPGENWEKASWPANKFMLEAVAGMRVAQEVKHSGELGLYDLSKLSAEELAVFKRAILASSVEEPVAGGDSEA
jgi:hypothetical protein